VITNNQLSNAEVGIWTLNIANSTIQNNQFHGITSPISNN